MIIKEKSWFLKKDIDIKELEKYGFYTLNNGASYWSLHCGFLVCYARTKRFVWKYHKWDDTVIEELICKGLVEKKNYYVALKLFGHWRNVSKEKVKRIEEKIDHLNKTKGYLKD